MSVVRILLRAYHICGYWELALGSTPRVHLLEPITCSRASAVASGNYSYPAVCPSLTNHLISPAFHSTHTAMAVPDVTQLQRTTLRLLSSTIDYEQLRRDCPLDYGKHIVAPSSDL